MSATFWPAWYEVKSLERGQLLEALQSFIEHDLLTDELDETLDNAAELPDKELRALVLKGAQEAASAQVANDKYQMLLDRLRRFSDMPLFRNRPELYDKHLLQLLDNSELEALADSCLQEWRDSLA